MRKLLFILLLFACTKVELPAQATHYIDPEGSDSNTGSASSPWLTLSYACSHTTSAGSTIHVNAGTYTSSTMASLSVGVSVIGDGSGTTHYNYTGTGIRSSSGITAGALMLSSAMGTNGNQTISGIDFNGGLTFDGTNGGHAIVIKGRSNVIIHDCIVEDFYSSGISYYAYDLSPSSEPITYSTGNKIYNCTISNNGDTHDSWNIGGSNIQCNGQDGFEVYNCTLSEISRAEGHNGNIFSGDYNIGLKFHDNISTKPDYDGTDWNFHIEHWYSHGGCEIYGNEFYGGDCPIDCGGGTVYSYNHKGSYNFSWYIYGNYFESTAYTTYHGKFCVEIEGRNEDVWVIGNHFKNIATCINAEGIITNLHVYYNIMENCGRNDKNAINLGLNYGALTNINICNNDIVIYSGSSAGGICVYNTSANTTFRVINNIIRYASYGAYFYTVAGSSAINGLVIANNCLYNNTNSNNPLFNVSPVGGTYSNANNLKTDPLYTSSSNYYPTSLSPCIGAGIELTPPTGMTLTDYAGNTILTPPTIGAYEYTGISVYVPSVTTGIFSVGLTTASGTSSATGSAITARGVCYSSTNQAPTLSDSYTEDGSGTGSFTSSLSGLTQNTTYYIRAYATNSAGTGYGSRVIVRTLSPTQRRVKDGVHFGKDGSHFVKY